jgi:BirA family biotin operon repressor/biotin-[acetyl-CoA-carboxylase] ligase
VFNLEKFNIKLNTDYIGRNFIYCEDIDSTNTFLLSQEEYEKYGTVTFAEFQTEGRGRKDREWWSAKGQNLTFSILLTKGIAPKLLNFINLGSAVAIGKSIENLFQLKAEMKWPNDILINNKKVAGILIESTSNGGNIKRVVVGIGINVNQPNFTGKFAITPTSIKRELKREVSREKFLSEVLNNFEQNLKIAKDNPSKLLDDWRIRCEMIGKKIKIKQDEKEIFGIFEDIDKNGFLILKMGNEKKVLHFGDIILH